MALWYPVAAGRPGPATLYRAGIILPVVVVGPAGHRSTLAMWDTGSQISSVSAALLAAVGSPKIGSVPISTVQGGSTVPAYMAAVNLQQGGYALSRGQIHVLGDDLPGSVGVLVGRDVQAAYRLVVDGPGGWFSVYAQTTPAQVQQRALVARVALGVGAVALVAGGAIAIAAAA